MRMSAQTHQIILTVIPSSDSFTWLLTVDTECSRIDILLQQDGEYSVLRPTSPTATVQWYCGRSRTLLLLLYSCSSSTSSTTVQYCYYSSTT